MLYDQGQQNDRRFDLGVLFIHGIGHQRPSETLVGFGDPLIHYLKVSPTYANLTSAGDSTPARAEVEYTIHSKDNQSRKTQWVLAEGYWADTVITPTFGSLVGWCFRILPWTLLMQIQEKLLTEFTAPQAVFMTAIPVLAARIVYTVLSTVMGLLLAPLLFVMLLVVLVIGSLPFAALKDLAAGLQRVLARTVGDSMILLGSPIQRAAILDRVHASYAWLAQQCDRVAIVAHSQGAAIAHELLRDRSCPAVRLLITFGSGLRKLTDIRQFSQRASSDVLWLAAIGGIAATILLYELIGRIGVRAVVAIAAILGFALLLWVILDHVRAVVSKLDEWRYRMLHSGRKPPERDLFSEFGYGLVTHFIALALEILVFFGSTWVIGGSFLGEGAVAARVFLMSFAASALVTALSLVSANETYVLRMTRSEDQQRRFDKLFKLPESPRWVDIYTMSDPVPNGPLVTGLPDSGNNFVSVEIRNCASTIFDHTSYWRNYEQFVSLVARELTDLLRKDSDYSYSLEYIEKLERERDSRVTALRRGRVVALGFVALLAWTRWNFLLSYSGTVWPHVARALEALPILGGYFSGVRSSPGIDMAGAWLLAATAAAVAYLLTFLLWMIWDHAESTGRYVSPGSSIGVLSKYCFPGFLILLAGWSAWEVVALNLR
jgi:hypothetical protein